MFQRWFKRPKDTEPHFAPISPDQPVVAIGDIHGRYDLLKKIPEAKSGVQMVCLGDMIDRGEESAQVLRHMCKATNVITLMGNHEEMMLNFLQNPLDNGPRWLRNGGLQTLESFAVTGVSQTSTGEDLEGARDALFAAMGQDLLDWLTNLPKYWVSGNVAFLHAAADPSLPIEQQDNRTLLWGHKDFGRVARTDGMWVVHGHTIFDSPRINRGVVSIDTGAYATGKLTAATIHEGEVDFAYA